MLRRSYEPREARNEAASDGVLNPNEDDRDGVRGPLHGGSSDDPVSEHEVRFRCSLRQYRPGSLTDIDHRVL